MSYRIKLFIAFSFLCVLVPANAQEPPRTSPTGILVKQELALAHLEALDGEAVSVPVSPARWRQSVFELQRAATTDLKWPQPRVLATAALENTPRNAVPLALLHARYDRLEANQAMQTEDVFAFAPVRAASYYGEQVLFTLDSADMLEHEASEILELWFDAGDGLGFRPLQPGGEVAASYATTGSKSLRLSAALSDGRVLLAMSELDVVQLATPDPTETWQITASETWEGVAGSGQAYIYLAEGHSELTNPVVVVEGFDIDNSIDWPVLYDLLNQENLLEDLRAAGYDAVVLDFTEAVDAIQRNALVLTELLQRVNAESPPGQSSVLIGASMGGLVARYGLLWMEQQSIAHGVRTFISFDSPQAGANIPLGVQEWVAFFASEAEEAAYLISRLNAPASRQMLLYHLGSTAGSTANPDPAKALLDAEFLTLGDWPQAPRRVSIANGSGAMADQGFSAGEQVILYEYRGFLANIDGDVWAVPNGGSQLIFDGRIDPILGSTSSNQVTVAGTLPWDNAPGGSRASMDQLANVTAPYGDIIALHGSHSFIPTVSALALETDDPFYDIAGQADLLGLTEFDQVYFPADNQEHIEITPQSKAWFLAEIQAGITVSLISGDTTESAGTATFMIAAQSPPTAPISISLNSSDPTEGSVAATVILPGGSTEPQMVTVTGVDDDSADGSVMYMIITGVASSADNIYDGINPADVSVINLDDEPDTLFINGFES